MLSIGGGDATNTKMQEYIWTSRHKHSHNSYGNYTAILYDMSFSFNKTVAFLGTTHSKFCCNG